MLSARSATPSVTRLSRCSIGCSLHRLFHQRLALGAVPFQRPVDAQHFLAFGVVDQRYRQPSRLHRALDHLFLVAIGLEVPTPPLHRNSVVKGKSLSVRLEYGEY